MYKLFGKIESLRDVVSWELCVGCGACYSACDKNIVSLVNQTDYGIVPVFETAQCGSCRKCLEFCPGYGVDATANAPEGDNSWKSTDELGLALEVYEGYATDPEIRYKGSSGGVLTAISAYCLMEEKYELVAHTEANREKPWGNTSAASETREDLVARTGSRYAPSSPCDNLRRIERSAGNCVFIGKPCDTAATWRLRETSEDLKNHLALILTFFCAGVPSEQGALQLIESVGYKKEDMRTVRYRGYGWPGEFKACTSTGEERTLDYGQSWGALTKHRPKRCHLCPDGLGRVSDIACGDAWDKLSGKKTDGLSLIIVRSERGRQILHKAVAAGYLKIEKSDSSQVVRAQAKLLSRRHEIHGRLIGMRLLGMPIPQFKGFSLRQAWQELTVAMKIRTVLGTMVRLIRTGKWRRNKKERFLESACGQRAAGIDKAPR